MYKQRKRTTRITLRRANTMSRTRVQEVAEFACTCERYVGTQSGGMDQAISMMGMPGVAQLINFHPVPHLVLPTWLA